MGSLSDADRDEIIEDIIEETVSDKASGDDKDAIEEYMIKYFDILFAKLNERFSS